MTPASLLDDGVGSLLFLSCDLVGSTQYKQSKNEMWPKAFLSFYREFPQALANEVGLRGSTLQFVLWKAVGDELLFVLRVKHETEVKEAIDIWVAAMGNYERDSLFEEKMAAKGGAFIATFPGPDSVVSIPLDPLSETSDQGVVELNDLAIENYSPDAYLYDFLGPSVDTGFRVMSSAEARYFLLSVEVAWAYCRGAMRASMPNVPELTMMHTIPLKGVWSGREYPVFALDRHYGDAVNTAVRALNGAPHSLTDIDALCKSCSEAPGWPSQLYLPDSDHPPFKETPTDALAPARLNAMEGAETVPAPDPGAQEALAPDPPMG